MAISKVVFTRRKPNLRYVDGQWLGYKIDVRVAGKRYRNTFPTRGEAQRFIDELKAAKVYSKAGLKTGHSPNVSDLFARRVLQIQNPKEIVRAVRVFDYFGTLLGQDELVTDIRSLHFQLFINARIKDGVKPETINREMTLLSTAFRRAGEIFPRELEGYDPPRITRPRFKQKRRERVITEKENKAILKRLYVTSTRIARMWHIGWLLGLRYSEIARLLKSDYKDSSLRVMRWKTNTVTIFQHLPSEAVDVIESAIKDSETDYVFTHSGSTPKNFYPILKEAAQSVGLTWGRDGVDSITFHSLRHSFITRLIQVTDIATAKSFSGHSDDTMVALYSHASDESKKKAMEAMYGTVDLRVIYDKVRSGKMAFEAFIAALK